MQSDVWKEWKETYCDGECNDDDLVKQNRDDDRGLWRWLCNWIKLNTDFPIIWNCIKITKWNGSDPTNVFPTMMWALSQIVVSLVLVVCFILIIVAGIMRASEWEGNAQKAKDLIKKVAITIVLLWLAWVILKAINPVFFS